MEIKDKSLKELETLSQEIRDRIIDVVSRKGGHFSSTLGAVELTLGMHYVFDAYSDPFICITKLYFNSSKTSSKSLNSFVFCSFVPIVILIAFNP